MSRNKVIVWAIVLISSVLIGLKLCANKKAIQKDAELSLVSHEYLPVKVASPKYMDESAALTADGIFLPRKEMWVLSETQGHIVDVFKAKGDYVKAGDALAKVDDEMLNIELQTVRINLDKLKKDQARLSNLIEADAVAKNKIEEVELGIATAEAKIKGLQKQINNTTIRAPMDGVITYRVIEKDGVIGLGIQVAQITDISSLNLMVRVPEQDINRVKKGQQAQVVADVLPQRTFSGIVKHVGLKADNAFTFDIEVEVKNSPDLQLKAGMHAKSTFVLRESGKGMFIPATALVGSRQDPKVYLVREDKAVLQPVTLGVEKGDQLEVTSGLELSDLLIVSGQLTLSDGAKVKVSEGD